MDKSDYEQLKKLVMDLDRDFTRLKSFVDHLDTDNSNVNDSVSRVVVQKVDSVQTPNAPTAVAPTQARPAPSTQLPKPPITVPPQTQPQSQPQPQAQKQQPVQNNNQATTNTVLSPTQNKNTEMKTDSVNAEGPFDGQYLVSANDVKLEVPASYAAKSRILYGDVVQAYSENGEQKFKVLNKQPRKSLKALTTKREGKWYVVTGLGSYKISDNAAEFNKLEVNQEVNVLVPENNTNVPFAVFDEIVTNQSNNTQRPVQNNSSRPTPPAPNRPRMPQNNQSNQGNQSRPAPAPVQNRPMPQQNNQGNNTNNSSKTNPQAETQPSVDPNLKVVEDYDLV